MSQTDQVIKHLESGKGLTAISALQLYGIFRLAARINEARMRGVPVKTDCIVRGGKRYARYRLEVA